MKAGSAFAASMRTKSNRLEELFVRLTGDEAAAKREQAA